MLVDIYNYLDPQTMEVDLDFNTYGTWRKELIKKFKEWDKMYLKHIKAVYPEMSGIHKAAMEPLTILVAANLQFHRLEELIKKTDPKEIPEFRYIALEEEFIKHMTAVCEIFKEFGDLKEHPFDIKQLMKTLKIHDWKNIVPFRTYLHPLLNNLVSTREELLQMNKRGHLLIKYIVEDNKELQTRMKGLVNCDNTVQWLLGDELKQDQFKFLYDTINIIYESALRDRLLNTDQRIIDSVIPKLTAYRSIMRIRDI